MNSNQEIIEEDEIDIRDLFSTIGKYKYSIFAISLLTAILAYIYLYYTPNIYNAKATIEVSSKKGSVSADDMLMAALDQGGSDIDTELEIIKSRYVVSLALENVDMGHHYYAYGAKKGAFFLKQWLGRFKKIELYEKSPLAIDVKKGFDVPFVLIPKGDNGFELNVDKYRDINGTKWSYEGSGQYGKWLKTKYFEIKIDKTGDIKYKKYMLVMDNPVYLADRIRRELSVSQLSKKASIASVSYNDNIPLRAKRFVNAIAKSYLSQSINEKTKEATMKLKFVEEQLALITKSLDSASSKLEKYKTKSNNIDLTAKAKMLLQRSTELKVELEKLKIQKGILQDVLNRIKRGRGVENIAIVGLEQNSEVLAKLVSDLQKAIIQKKTLLQDFTPQHPEVIKTSSTIRQLKNTIISSLKSILRETEQREKFIQKSLSRQNKILATLPKNERDLSSLQRNYMVNEKIYTYLLEKRTEVAFAKASTISKNRIIDSALLPIKPIKPKRKLVLLVALIVGFILGLVQAFLRAFLSNKIESKEDIEKLTTISVSGLIPHSKNITEGVIDVMKDPKSPISEAFRALRTNLKYLSKGKDKLVISTTSTVPGEGKTFISTNLSAIMAITKKRVVVINMDLRKPTLHKRFGLSNATGASSYLSGSADLDAIIQHSKIPNLDIVTSGPTPPNPGELIDSDELVTMISELKKRYDVVIIDTPPVGIVAETKHILEVSDIVIYTMRSNYSRKEYVRSAEDVKKHTDGSVTIALNDITSKGGGYGYGYGYGYSY